MHGQELIHTSNSVIFFQVPEDLLKDVADNVRKLMDDVRRSQAPEATAFLRLLGNEIGYMKLGDIQHMIETLSMYFHFYIRILPAQVRYSFLTWTLQEKKKKKLGKKVQKLAAGVCVVSFSQSNQWASLSCWTEGLTHEKHCFLSYKLNS